MSTRGLWEASDAPALTCTAISVMALLIPLWLVEIPPLLDYPNHLARMWLLAGGLRSGPLSQIYGVDWRGASTNIGVDLFASTVGRVLPGLLVGRLMLAAATLLPAIGAICLNARIFGVTPWQIAFPVCAWSLTLVAGFLNFQIGLGLALLAVAADPWLGRRGGATAISVRTLIGIVLLIDHPFALMFYAALLAGMTFGEQRPTPGSPKAVVSALFNGLRAGAVCIVALIIVGVAARARAGAGVSEAMGAPLWGTPILTDLKNFMPLATYNLASDAMFTALIAVAPIYALARGRLRCHAGLLVATAGLVAIGLLMPGTIGHTGWINRRLPQMAMWTALAAINPAIGSTSRARRLTAGALLALAVVRTAWIGGVWSAGARDVTAVRSVLSAVPPGSAVLPLDHTFKAPLLRLTFDPRIPPARFIMGKEPVYWHYAALSVPWRQAFVPTLFSARGKQPLIVHEPWRQIAIPEVGPVSIHALDPVHDPAIDQRAPYISQWRSRFDYVLVLNADLPDAAGPFAPPPGLIPVRDSGFAQLFRIERPAHASPTVPAMRRP